MITTILFDMDGTLLPMEVKKFEKIYFKTLAMKLAPLGYEPNKLIEGVLAGTKAMICNDGSATNDVVFWKVFAQIFGDRAYNDIPSFDEYYRTDFVAAKEGCGYNEKAAEVVRKLKNSGKTIVVATNPLFPLVAQEARLNWSGVRREDVDYVTHYENSRYCKPNLNYYVEIMENLGVKGEECIMIGNDVNEDMIAEKLDMKVFLLTDCLINPDGKDISAYPHGNFDDLNDYLDKIL